MNRGIPVSNKIITNKINERNRQIHLAKINGMKSNLSKVAPQTFSHLSANKKKIQVQEDRLSQIERENRMLLDRLTGIMKAGQPGQQVQTVQLPTRTGTRSLNRDLRKRELVKITIENQQMLSRLNNKKSSYNRGMWERDSRQHEVYLKNLCEYPVTIVPITTGSVDGRPSTQSVKGGTIYSSPKANVANKFSSTFRPSEDASTKFLPVRNTKSDKLEPLTPNSNQKKILYQTKKQIGFSNYLVHVYLHNNTFNIIASNNERGDFKTLSIPKADGEELIARFGGHFEDLIERLRFKGNSILINNGSMSMEAPMGKESEYASNQGRIVEDENEFESSRGHPSIPQSLNKTEQANKHSPSKKSKASKVAQQSKEKKKEEVKPEKQEVKTPETKENEQENEEREKELAKSQEEEENYEKEEENYEKEEENYEQELEEEGEQLKQASKREGNGKAATPEMNNSEEKVESEKAEAVVKKSLKNEEVDGDRFGEEDEEVPVKSKKSVGEDGHIDDNLKKEKAEASVKSKGTVGSGHVDDDLREGKNETPVKSKKTIGDEHVDDMKKENVGGAVKSKKNVQDEEDVDDNLREEKRETPVQTKKIVKDENIDDNLKEEKVEVPVKVKPTVRDENVDDNLKEEKVEVPVKVKPTVRDENVDDNLKEEKVEVPVKKPVRDEHVDDNLKEPKVETPVKKIITDDHVHDSLRVEKEESEKEERDVAEDIPEQGDYEDEYEAEN